VGHVQHLVVLRRRALGRLDERPGGVEEVGGELALGLRGQLANVLVAHERFLSLDQRLEPLARDLELGGPGGQPPAVVGEQRESALGVVLVEHRGDVRQRQLDRSQEANGRGSLELVAAVQPVAGLGIDRGRPQEALLVVQAKGLRREPGQAGEAADRHEVHDLDRTPCPRGKVNYWSSYWMR
jgi:hypothetical protein